MKTFLRENLLLVYLAAAALVIIAVFSWYFSSSIGLRETIGI